MNHTHIIVIIQPVSGLAFGNYVGNALRCLLLGQALWVPFFCAVKRQRPSAREKWDNDTERDNGTVCKRKERPCRSRDADRKRANLPLNHHSQSGMEAQLLGQMWIISYTTFILGLISKSMLLQKKRRILLDVHSWKLGVDKTVESGNNKAAQDEEYKTVSR